MPRINTTGQVTKGTPGFQILGVAGKRRLLFGEGTLPTTLKVQYVQDDGSLSDLEDGEVTALPSSMVVDCDNELQIEVTGGSPDFVMTPGGVSNNR